MFSEEIGFLVRPKQVLFDVTEMMLPAVQSPLAGMIHRFGAVTSAQFNQALKNARCLLGTMHGHAGRPALGSASELLFDLVDPMHAGAVGNRWMLPTRPKHSRVVTRLQLHMSDDELHVGAVDPNHLGVPAHPYLVPNVFGSTAPTCSSSSLM